jgi:hypothetical protein
MSTSNLRNVSPFIAFCNANRHAVKAANPTAGFGEMGKILATLWKEMSNSEKAVYTNFAVRQNNGVTNTTVVQTNEPTLRRSSRLRNKRLGVDFFGIKVV